MSRAPSVSGGRIAVAYAFLGLLAALAAATAFVVTASVGDMEAAVAAKSELLADLRARALPVSRAGAGPAVPPEAAYLAGETEAVAANLLQQKVTAAVEQAGGTPASVGVTEVVDGIGGSRRIGVEIAFAAGIDAVQAALFALETGVPYVFTDALTLDSEAAGEAGGGDPRLRATLRVSGYWRPAGAPALPAAGASGT